MALQRDYILRMIDMMADLIAGVLGLMKKKQFPEAEQKINRAFDEFFHQNAEYFDDISSKNFVEVLKSKGQFTNEHFQLLSDLFYVRGKLYFAQNKINESLEFYQKSLALLDYVDQHSQTYSFDNQKNISDIKNKIQKIVDQQQ